MTYTVKKWVGGRKAPMQGPHAGRPFGAPMQSPHAGPPFKVFMQSPHTGPPSRTPFSIRQRGVLLTERQQKHLQ